MNTHNNLFTNSREIDEEDDYSRPIDFQMKKTKMKEIFHITLSAIVMNKSLIFQFYTKNLLKIYLVSIIIRMSLFITDLVQLTWVILSRGLSQGA